MSNRIKLMLFTIISSITMFILSTNIIFGFGIFEYPPGANKYAIYIIWLLSAINIIIRTYYYPQECKEQ